ncbi:MAG: hypothetical protein ABFR90_02925 [Planctomycetota bacterium]
MRTAYSFVFISLVCLVMPSLQAATIYVDASASGANNGTSWADAFLTIQNAVNLSSHSDEIIVAEGEYYENIDMAGKQVLLRSTTPDDPNVVAATIIDGGGSGSVITCETGETADTIIQGFTIQNGGGNSDKNAGGISCYESSPSVKQCVFINNTADHYGGGIFCYLGAPTIANCAFLGNTANYYGGGGLSCYQSNVMVMSCVFSGNTAAMYGGGLHSYESDQIVASCTFSGNSSNFGGGIYCFESNAPVISNSILWGNSVGADSQIYTYNSTPTLIYCVIEGGWTGDGSDNITSDPLFVDADGADDAVGTADDDLHLDPFSLCINMGDPAASYSGQYDMDGQKRACYQRIDIGSDEVFPIGGDLNTDEQVGVADLVIFADSSMWLAEVDLVEFAFFAEQWLYGAGPVPGDLTGDKKVDMDDLILLVSSDKWLVQYDLADFSLLARNWLYGVQ